MSQSTASSWLIWSVADLLRGNYKPSEYRKVILPFTVLRWLDCVLAPTKSAVLAEKARREASGVNTEPFLLRVALDLKKLMGDQDHIATNLTSYVQGFSVSVRDIFERFRFAEQVDRLRKAGLLYKVNSLNLQDELMKAIMDAMAAHQTMGRRALNSENVQAGILSALLGPGALWETLRSADGMARAAAA